MTDWLQAIGRDDWDEWRMAGSRVVTLTFRSPSEADAFGPGAAVFLAAGPAAFGACVGVAVAHETARSRHSPSSLQARLQLHLALPYDEGIPHGRQAGPCATRLAGPVADACYHELRNAKARIHYEEATP